MTRRTTKKTNRRVLESHSLGHVKGGELRSSTPTYDGSMENLLGSEESGGFDSYVDDGSGTGAGFIKKLPPSPAPGGTEG